MKSKVLTRKVERAKELLAKRAHGVKDSALTERGYMRGRELPLID